MKTRSLSGLVGVALFCLVTPNVDARTWYITPGGTGDAPTVQAGIDSSTAGDTVLVACGTYYEHDIIMKSGVCLKGEVGFPPCAVLDAQHQSKLVISHSNDASTLIEGLTLSHASVCAVDCVWSFVTVRDCVFSDNVGQGFVVTIVFGAPRFYNCLFYGNHSEDHYPAPVIAVAYSTTHATLSHCTIAENSAGVTVNADAGITVENSIIAFCMDGNAFGGDETTAWADISCCNLFGNHGSEDSLAAASGIACFSADPQFCGILGSRNFYLQSDSPCAPGNHPGGNECGVIGALPALCGAVEAQTKTWGNIKSLYKLDD
jgi:hypothetical protein